MKRALIVAATGGFLNGFLIPDMKLLQEMGYEVHCAANGNSVSTFVPEKRFASIGVTFHQIDFSSTSPISKESLTAYKQYKELLNRYHFDFVHVHTPIPGAIVRMATRRKRKRGCVVVYTTHGLTYHINGVGVDTSRYHECQIDRETYRKSLGLSENDIAILEVGELSTRKNHKVIIDALEKLADQRYVFLICGKAMSNLGTYDFLKKYAVEKNVRVIFLGFRKDIPEINRCADIAVLPSLREGLGLAGIEALASGVPVVGSDVQGIKDYVVDGETGYLCAPTDADAFAEKIKLLSDREVRSSMQKACVEKAEEFRLEISHQQMTDIYKNLLDGQEKSK